MAEGILPRLLRRYVHLDSIAVTMSTCVAAVVAMVERRGCLHGSVCSHIAHTNCLYRGHPAEKGHLHLRRISWLRLHRTSSDDLKLFRFPLALSEFLFVKRLFERPLDAVLAQHLLLSGIFRPQANLFYGYANQIYGNFAVYLSSLPDSHLPEGFVFLHS